MTTQNSQQFGELLRSVEIRFAPGAIRNADQILRDLEGASLQSISMWSSDVTDVGLASLSRSRTQTVDLCFCKSITDDGLSHLVKIPGLREVHLRETPITDDGVRHLSQIEALWRLNLDDTNTTDIGLTALVDLAHLHELYLRGTKVTDGLPHE